MTLIYLLNGFDQVRNRKLCLLHLAFLKRTLKMLCSYYYLLCCCFLSGVLFSFFFVPFVTFGILFDSLATLAGGLPSAYFSVFVLKHVPLATLGGGGLIRHETLFFLGKLQPTSACPCGPSPSRPSFRPSPGSAGSQCTSQEHQGAATAPAAPDEAHQEASPTGPVAHHTPPEMNL